jgi:hypothetical protein
MARAFQVGEDGFAYPANRRAKSCVRENAVINRMVNGAWVPLYCVRLPACCS